MRRASISSVPRSKCPACLRALDTAVDAGGVTRPRAGSLTVCAHCLGVAAFTARLRLRRVTESELKGLPDETRQAIVNIKARIVAGRARKRGAGDDGRGSGTIH